MPTFIATYLDSIPIGLANYLKNIFSCYRLNELVKNNVTQFVDADYQNIFSSFFKNSDMLVNITNYEDIIFNLDSIESLKNIDKIHLIYDWKLYVDPTDNIQITQFANEMFEDNHNMIDNRYTNIPQHMREIYLNVISKFTINDSILDNVNIQINAPFMAVHIRTWKNITGSPDRYKHYLDVISDYIDIINISEYNNILICTDNLEESSYVIDSLNTDKNIMFYKYNSNLNKLQNDFSELLLMSKASKIVGSVNSTFTELAWWYSNCKSEIVIL